MKTTKPGLALVGREYQEFFSEFHQLLSVPVIYLTFILFLTFCNRLYRSILSAFSCIKMTRI